MVSRIEVERFDAVSEDGSYRTMIVVYAEQHPAESMDNTVAAQADHQRHFVTADGFMCRQTDESGAYLVIATGMKLLRL